MNKSKYQLVIFSYDREEALRTKISEIKDFFKELDYHLLIIDDGSDFKIEDEKNISFIQTEHTGKPGFYKKWQIMYDYLLQTNFDYIIISSDDLLNTDYKSILEILNPDDEIVYNINNDQRIVSWVNKYPEPYNDKFEKVYFVDCAYFTNIKIYRKMNRMIDIDPIRFKHNNNISSGVGQYQSSDLLDNDILILRPINSLALHDVLPSKMHMNERFKNPLGSFKNDRDPIYISIATMNSRKYALDKVLRSLDNQTVKADKIFIYNNDENIYNATDNAKFYAIEHLDLGNCYYLTCDDDILYPEDYIERMVNAIDYYKCVCTFHGRILNGLDLNYYSGHKIFSCSNIQTKNIEIDVPGTGVSGFHTSYFKPENIFYNEYQRMSDVLLGYECARQDIKIMNLYRPHNWFYLLNVDLANSCYIQEKSKNKQVNHCNYIYNKKYLNKNTKEIL